MKGACPPALRGRVPEGGPSRPLAVCVFCPQHLSIPLANCWADQDCPEGETGTHSHGKWAHLAGPPRLGLRPRDPGWSASLLPFSLPPQLPCPGPMEIRGPGVCPVFPRHKDGPVRVLQCDPQDLRNPGLVSSGERCCARVSPQAPRPPPDHGACLTSPLPGRKPLLLQAENFTLFIKNTVTFSKFNFSR